MSDVAPTSSVELSDEPVRRLTKDDLGLTLLARESQQASTDSSAITTDDPLPETDSILAGIIESLDTYAGFIFSGPPGTSKSWYARKVGEALTKGKPDLLRFVQFHPSYQYEDFVVGYEPTGSGFELTKRHLLQMCQVARENPGEWAVLVIDELSRGDSGRIFGEALTYVEKSKRELEFRLACGWSCSIPDNLVFLATMNPLDRGVDEVDAAFERRFAKIVMTPDAVRLDGALRANGMDDRLRARLIEFFRMLNGQAASNPFASVGHTYFMGARDESDLQSIWNYQLGYLLEKAYRLDPDSYSRVLRAWQRVIGAGSDAEAEPVTVPTDASVTSDMPDAAG